MPARCLLVGVLNATPDSFSDGGRFNDASQAVAAGVDTAAVGADWLDVGGESTRPGSLPVAEDEETRRVVPVIEGLRKALGNRVRLSVDTYKAGTARAAIAAGADVVNDVSGGCLDPRLLDVAAAGRAAVVLGHLRGAPAEMNRHISFVDVVREVEDELLASIDRARRAGCREIWADLGIGFGKELEHNLALLRALPRFVGSLGVPIMIGVSRKRFVGTLTGKAEPRERLMGTAAAVATSVLLGAAAVRVHDVAELRDVVAVAQAIRGTQPGVNLLPCPERGA